MTTTPLANPTRPARSITLYGFRLSGHAHRAELFLSLLGLPVDYVDVDLPGQQQKTPEFLALNCFGQVPVIDDSGTIVADSNAILVYLATRYGNTGWLPTDPVGAAAVQRWLSVAAGQLANGPAAARFSLVFNKQLNGDAVQRAHALLQAVEGELGERAFLVGTAPSVADIALYTYIAHAPEGGVELAAYPQVRGWLGRIEALPGFVPMQRVPS